MEEKFPNHKSLKPSSSQTTEAQEYFKLERQLFSAWMYWLTGNGGHRAKKKFTGVLDVVEQVLGKSRGPFFLENATTTVVKANNFEIIS